MPVNVITGTAQADFLMGTKHRDLFHAGSGDDNIFPNGGHDTAYGGIGDDTVFGYFGNILIYGGAGDDHLVAASSVVDSHGRVYGGAGDDDIFLREDTVLARGGSGADMVAVYLLGGGGAVHGGAGRDTLNLNFDSNTFAQFDAMVVLATGSDATVSVNGMSALDIDGFEQLIVRTQDGDDQVRGGAFDDLIDVAAGNNMVMAGAGQDIVTYRTGGQNQLDGGAGSDMLRIVYGYLDTGLDLDLSADLGQDQHGSTFGNFEHFQVYGGGLADHAVLGQGGDTFHGSGGEDHGFGKGGADQMSGGSRDDVLSGGSGADTLSGGRGQDVLDGGWGADRFAFRWLDQAGDQITDFTSGSDHVAIRARGLDHLVPRGVLEAGLFHQDAALGTGGQFILRPGATPDSHDLIWDANGDAAGGETQILTLSNGATMTASDVLIF